jgi:hypothetical protein
MSNRRNVQSIPISQARPGKTRHGSLSAQQEDLARQLYDICGYLVQPTFEQWERAFLKDGKPARDLLLWYIISETFVRLCRKYPNEAHRNLLGEIVLRSSGGMPTKYPEIVEVYATVSREIVDGECDE